MNSVNNLSKKQKRIILGLLSFIIILLLFLLFLPSNNSVKTRKNTGSRTIMMYIDGSNLETNSKIVTADLNSIDYQNIDLNSYHILLYTGGTEKWHNFISNEENAIYELTNDGFKKVKTYEQLSMGDPNTLSEFLNYGYNNYQSDLYDLVFYNHGGAIDGAMYDSFTNDHLLLEEFGTALKNSNFNENNKLNTILFRTCLNGTLEVANKFKDYADYLIASEEVTVGSGRTSVLNYVNNLDPTDDGISYGKKFIAAYEQNVTDIQKYSLVTDGNYSIIDLTKINDINKLFNEFIASVDLSNNYKSIVRLRDNLFQYGTEADDGYDTVDIYDLVENLGKYASTSNENLLNTIKDTIKYNWRLSDETKGLSIYFPYKGSKTLQTRFLGVYQNVKELSDYYKFINTFSNYQTSNQKSSFSAKTLVENNTEVSNNEFSLNLTAEEANDFAGATFIVFAKNQEDGRYSPIYSSDKYVLTDDNVLKTNIGTNGLLKFNVTNSNGVAESSYIPVIAKNNNLLSPGYFQNFHDETMGPNDLFKNYPFMAYIEDKNGTPEFTRFVANDDNGASGAILNPNNYENIVFHTTHYDILDENGNYKEDWDNHHKIYGIESAPSNYYLSYASFSDDTEYYCVFKISDVYGNSYYSKMVSLR